MSLKCLQRGKCLLMVLKCLRVLYATLKFLLQSSRLWPRDRPPSESIWIFRETKYSTRTSYNLTLQFMSLVEWRRTCCVYLEGTQCECFSNSSLMVWGKEFMSQMWIDTYENLRKTHGRRQRTEGQVPLTLQHIEGKTLSLWVLMKMRARVSYLIMRTREDESWTLLHNLISPLNEQIFIFRASSKPKGRLEPRY